MDDGESEAAEARSARAASTAAEAALCSNADAARDACFIINTQKR